MSWYARFSPIDRIHPHAEPNIFTLHPSTPEEPIVQ